jgi:hypothetical protein
MNPLHYSQYLSNQINEAINNNIAITDQLLSQIQSDFRRLKNNKFNTEKKIVVKRIRTFRKIHIPLKAQIGYKDESYFSESEMMLGYVAPSYEDLSKDEKEIWNELENEKVV